MRVFLWRNSIIFFASLRQLYGVDAFSCLSNDINHNGNKARDTDHACRFIGRYSHILSSMTNKRQCIRDSDFFSMGY